jgi:hypothetical protein
MPDGSTVPWDYDTVRKIAKILTVDKNGKDATEAGFDPDNIVPVGLRPQRDDLRQVGAYWKAGQFMSSDGKTVQIPEAWAAAWHYFYDGIWKDHVSVTGPQFLNTDFNPGRLPVLHRQGRDERELPVVDLRRQRRRRRLEPRGHAVLPGPDRRPPSTPTHSAS